MDLKQYIAESERTYTYRLKTIVPLDDYAMDRIERVCMKYQPLDISKPRKTLMQKNPLDFTNIDAAEVWIVDLEFAQPASSYALGQEVRHALGVPENNVIVRGSNDPTEVESERLVASEEIAAEAKEQGLTPSGLLTDPTYSEVTPGADLYGKVHNEKFLDYLRTVQKEREAKSRVDAPNPLFRWMDMPEATPDDDGAYNADIPNAPRIGKAGKDAKPDETVSDKGILTDRKRTYKRQYGKDGERTTLSRSVDTTKDPK
jgi:hypothetical protein